MKTLKCDEVAGIVCDFVATGETDAEVKAKLGEHGMAAHAEMMAGMTDEQKAGMATKIDQLLAAQ
jgi:predicted small metal-binding protein